MPHEPTVLLAISGSIAAYKACDLVRLLRDAGCRVLPLMTPDAARFIPPLTVGVLAGGPVFIDYFDPQHNGAVDHIGLVQNADVFVAAPATANLIAKLALGLADDYPSLVGVAFPRPWVIAPAMNSRMYLNAALQGHLATLRARGAMLVEPEEGLLACGEVGVGKLASPEKIRDAVLAILRQGHELEGTRVLVTAGGTREPVDAVRYLGNRSSGRMGFALAEEAARRGAQVTLLTTVPPPPMARAVQVEPVETTAQLAAALEHHAPTHDVIIMAAAVADYTVVPVPGKLHRGENPRPTLHLEPTPDLLASLVQRRRPGQTIMGFAAEVENLEGGARAKYAAKGCDLLVANDVSDPAIGFGSPDNAVLVITGPAPDDHITLPRAPKPTIAAQLWDLIQQQRRAPLSRTTPQGAPTHV